jgi:ATP-dependent DNA helicase RecQ
MTTESEFLSVANALREWPATPVPRVKTPHLRRLSTCLSLFQEGQQIPGWGDLAALIRYALRVDTPGTNFASLSVPSEPAPWPTNEQWALCGCDVEERGNSRFRVIARPWQPAWLPSRGASGVDSGIAQAPTDEGLRRRSAGVPADPFLRATFPRSSTDFSTYTSDAHQQAVRTVVSCQPGATVFINLPTGAGKSTVALAPAFVRGQPRGVSLVVVPTVALALDQERRVQELTGTSEVFAYTHSTPDDDRKRVRAAVRAGLQTVLFVSPESVTRSLAPALFDAAEADLIRYFVIDEAHLVDQWGTEFRPEFQAMAGLRRELLDTQSRRGGEPFRTLLMTATFTPASTDLLFQLFGEPGPVESAMSNLLRPEPSYWFSESPGWRRRQETVVEALRHLPRPAIVFTTRPQYANNLLTTLKNSGISRVAAFTGDTPDQSRRAVLEQFRNGQIDVVVATSAFGLGVDQEDVRTVIHACIPETIDRFYQEVGRGGRDGRASISLVCWTDGDKRDARGLATPRMIGEDKGLDRWRTMIGSATSLGESRYRVSVSSRRLSIDKNSEDNEKWNIRTLGLLARSGLLTFGWEQPNRDADGLPENFDDEDREFVIKLKYGVIDEAIWAEQVEPVRAEVATDTKASHRLMLDALEKDSATCELIAKAYDLSRIQSPIANHGAPAIVCGGCPVHPTGRVSGGLPLVWPAGAVPEFATPFFQSLGMNQGVRLLMYQRPTMRKDHLRVEESTAELLRRVVPLGVRLLVCPPSLVNSPALRDLIPELHQLVPDRVFFVHQTDRLKDIRLDELPQVPLLVFVTPDTSLPASWFEVLPGDPPRLFVVPHDLPDPVRAERLAADMQGGVMRVDQFLLKEWN